MTGMFGKTTCSFCGREFDETKAEAACRGCPSRKGCRRVKCPYCGYETPQQPRWIQWLKRWRRTT